MSDMANVGNLAESLSTGIKRGNVTGVTLWYDDEHAFTAGDDSGLMLEADCLWATQTMANNLLNELKEFKFQPYSADGVSIDPAVELGDAVSVGGIDSILGRIVIDAYGYSDIAAEFTSETEGEFAFKGTLSNKLARKVSLGESYYGTRITRADGLTIEKTDGENVSARVVLNADELSFYDGSNARVLFFDPATNTYKFMGELNVADNFVVDKTGNVTIRGNLAIPSGSIGFSELSDDAKDAVEGAAGAVEVVNGWTYRGTTQIDGRKIMSGTIFADALYGKKVTLWANSGVANYYYEAGEMDIDFSSSSSSYAIELKSNGALRLTGESGDVYLRANPVTGNYISLHLDRANNRVYTNKLFVSGSSPGSSSDRNKKNSIEPLPNKYESLFDSLSPVRFKYNDGDSGRYHTGFIAQDVEQAINDSDIDSNEFAGLIRAEDGYYLRYEEFIALCVDKIQKLEKRIEELERGVANG